MSFLLKDGGIGTALAASLPPDLPVCDLLNVSQPEAVLAVHQAFYAAGARLLTSNTFCCDPDSLAGTAFAGQAEELCRLGAELARSAAGPGAQVAGSLGPGWRYPSKGEIGLSELSESYALRARGLL
ncbi:MAG: methionine synthase, partial [Candidatus Melainabacteria bacterium HGW-Melainabacteria-1]